MSSLPLTITNTWLDTVLSKCSPPLCLVLVYILYSALANALILPLLDFLSLEFSYNSHILRDFILNHLVFLAMQPHGIHLPQSANRLQ